MFIDHMQLGSTNWYNYSGTSAIRTAIQQTLRDLLLIQWKLYITNTLAIVLGARGLG